MYGTDQTLRVHPCGGRRTKGWGAECPPRSLHRVGPAFHRCGAKKMVDESPRSAHLDSLWRRGVACASLASAGWRDAQRKAHRMRAPPMKLQRCVHQVSRALGGQEARETHPRPSPGTSPRMGGKGEGAPTSIPYVPTRRRKAEATPQSAPPSTTFPEPRRPALSRCASPSLPAAGGTTAETRYDERARLPPAAAARAGPFQPRSPGTDRGPHRGCPAER